MLFGINAPSFVPSDLHGKLGWPLRADDFVSDGRRITDVHWWGSYLGWCTGNPGPVQPPSDPLQRPLGLCLRWYADIPTNLVQSWSMPSNPPLASVFVPLERCRETYYGGVSQPWMRFGYWKHEFQYFVDLLDRRVPGSRAWYERTNTVYWLSIRAVFPEGRRPGQQGANSHFGWGWKTTALSNHWNDVSVVAANRDDMGQLVWKPALYPPPRPWEG